MATSLSTAVRTAMAQAIITAAGAAGAKIKAYNGTQPATAGTALSGNTLLATINWVSGAIGTTSAGAIDIDEAGATQTNSGHVSGTPTFVDITTSGDVVVARIPIGSGSFAFTGAIVAGQDVTLSGLSIAIGNP